MHRQPLYADAEVIGGAVSDRLTSTGSACRAASSLSEEDLWRVIASVRAILA